MSPHSPLSPDGGAAPVSTLDRTQAPAVHIIAPCALPGVETVTLSNGVTLHSYDGGSGCPDVGRLTVSLPGGRADKAGAVNLFEAATSMTMMGTASLTQGQIADTLDFNGAWASHERFNHCSLQRFFFLNSRLPDIAETLAELIGAPTFPEKEVGVGLEKMARRIELDGKRVARVARRLSKRMLFGDSPLGITPTVAEARAVTAPELAEAYRAMLCPGAIHAWLSGRLTPEVRRTAAAILETIPARGNGVAPKPITFAPRGAAMEREQVEGARQSAVEAVIALPGLHRSSEEFHRVRMAVDCLGGYFGSRLMLNIREERGLTYDIDASLYGSDGQAYLRISTECDSSYVDEVIEQIRAELAGMADPSTYTPDELQRLRSYKASMQAAQVDNPFSVMDVHQFCQAAGVTPDYYAACWRAIEGLSAESLAEAAASHFDPDALLIAVAGA